MFALPITIALIGLVIASYTDVKTREVPDWLNFSLISIGLGTRLLLSLSLWQPNHILEGIYGFGLGFILAYIMFYSGQWGGGDSKMLMGLGALLGLQFNFDNVFVAFLINLLFIGALYGLVWSTVAAIRHWSAFHKKVSEYVSKPLFKRLRLAAMAAVALALLLVFLFDDILVRIFLLLIAILSFLTLYVWVFVKSVEDACMLKWVKPGQLTEGDWIAREVKVKGKYICGPKDLGIRKAQIRLLKRLHKENKIKRVLTKEGIPFVPSFLVAFLIALVHGNLVLLFV